MSFPSFLVDSFPPPPQLFFFLLNYHNGPLITSGSQDEKRKKKNERKKKTTRKANLSKNLRLPVEPIRQSCSVKWRQIIIILPFPRLRGTTERSGVEMARQQAELWRRAGEGVGRWQERGKGKAGLLGFSEATGIAGSVPLMSHLVFFLSLSDKLQWFESKSESNDLYCRVFFFLKFEMMFNVSQNLPQAFYICWICFILEYYVLHF